MAMKMKEKSTPTPIQDMAPARVRLCWTIRSNSLPTEKPERTSVSEDSLRAGSFAFNLESHPRVNQAVEHIDNHRDDYYDESVNHHRTLDHGVVPAIYRSEQQGSDSIPGERLFCEDCSREKNCKL